MRSKIRAFTLIELLIVVAIIAILAAIAVPNFLEAQTRSKVSRVKADERSLATALEAYHVDHNDYPPSASAGCVGCSTEYLNVLSTPVAYITQGRVEDPFGNQEFNYVPDYGEKSIYFYARLERGDFWYDLFTGPASAFAANVPDYNGAEALLDDSEFMIMSAGPDRLFLQQWHQTLGAAVLDSYSLRYVDLILGRGQYDPTNGTISLGDITRTNRGVLSGGIR